MCKSWDYTYGLMTGLCSWISPDCFARAYFIILNVKPQLYTSLLRKFDLFCIYMNNCIVWMCWISGAGGISGLEDLAGAEDIAGAVENWSG